MMRPLRILAPLLALLPLTGLACSGRDASVTFPSADPAADDGSGSTTSSPPPPSGPSSGGTTGTGTTPTGDPSPNDPPAPPPPSGNPMDAGAPKDGDGGPSTGDDDGGAPHATDAGLDPSCTEAEVEPNDDPLAATPIVVGTACGTLSPATDVDNLRFVLRPDAKRIRATYGSSGPVAFRVTVHGQTVDALTAKSGPLPYYPGEAYVFEVRSANGKPQRYALTIRDD